MTGSSQVTKTTVPPLIYLLHMQVQAQALQESQGAPEDQVVLILGNQVGQENQQDLEDQQPTHLLDPTQRKTKQQNMSTQDIERYYYS